MNETHWQYQYNIVYTSKIVDEQSYFVLVYIFTWNKISI